MSARLQLIGKRFGRLLVVDQAPIKNQSTYWNCICDCGKETAIKGSSLTNGTTRSCGCLGRETSIKNGRNSRSQLIGKKFGRLAVLNSAPNAEGNPSSRWRCACDCGKIKTVFGANLVNKTTKSCGCLQKELARKK